MAVHAQRLPLSPVPFLIIVAVLGALGAVIWLLSGWFDDHYVSAPEEQRSAEDD
jgi:hypothetical protein